MLQRTFPAAMALLSLPESTSMSSVLLELCRRPRCTDSRFVSKVDAACPSVCAYVCVFTPLVSRSAVLRRPVCWCNWDSAHSCGVDGRQWAFHSCQWRWTRLAPQWLRSHAPSHATFFFFTCKTKARQRWLVGRDARARTLARASAKIRQRQSEKKNKNKSDFFFKKKEGMLN